jgi:LysR family nitrogen assimilation transcriptional regulator
MILPSRPHGLRRLIDNTLAEHGIYLRVGMELEAMPSTLLLVEEGQATRFCPMLPSISLSSWPHRGLAIRPAYYATAEPRDLPAGPMSSNFRPLFRAVRTEERDIISTHIWKPPTYRE